MTDSSRTIPWADSLSGSEKLGPSSIPPLYIVGRTAGRMETTLNAGLADGSCAIGTADIRPPKRIASLMIKRLGLRLHSRRRRENDAPSGAVPSVIEESSPFPQKERSASPECARRADLPTRWVRLRLRGALWQQWKTPAFGRRLCWNWGYVLGLPVMRLEADTVLGLARAKALSMGLSNAYLKSLGLSSLFESVSVTDSNRRVRTRMHGVAGVCG